MCLDVQLSQETKTLSIGCCMVWCLWMADCCNEGVEDMYVYEGEFIGSAQGWM